METTERLKLDVNGTYSVSKTLESGPQRIATFDLLMGETIEINVVTAISTYSKSIYLYSAAGNQIGYAFIAKTSTSGCITYTAANRIDGAYFVINSLEGLTYDIFITKSRPLMNRIENVEMVDSLEEWTSQFPDGFGRSSEEAPGVAVNLPIPLFTSRLYIKVRKLSEYVRINSRLSCNINTSSNTIDLRSQQFNNGAWAPDGTQMLVLDVAALLANSVPTGSEVTSLYFRFMQNSSTFYGMFTLEEWRYVTLDSLYNGKVDKELGKGLSSYDFSYFYRQVIENLTTYNFPDLFQKMQTLENLCNITTSASAVEAAVTSYLNAHPGAISPNVINVCCNNVCGSAARGNGTHDNYEDLQRIFNSLQGGEIIYFPPGTYLINFQEDLAETEVPQQASSYAGRREVCMTINVPNVTIIGDGSTIRVAQTMFWSYQVLNVTANGTNFLIKDLNLEGDYREHVYTNFYNAANHLVSHEFGYGIFIQGNGRVENCRIRYMTGDAIVTKNSSSYGGSDGSGSGGDIVIDHCELSHCRRQGISVLDSDDIWVRNSYIHDIGDIHVDQRLVLGCYPRGGVDLEPGSGTHHIRSFHLHDSIVKDNPVSIINGGANVELIDILNSECGLTCVNSQVSARNTSFVVDSAERVFNIPLESTLTGCHFTCTLASGEQTTLRLPRLYATDIVNNSEAILFLDYGGGLVNCYLHGMTIGHSCAKGDTIGTTFDHCSLEHASQAESMVFNGCTIKSMAPLDYYTDDGNGGTSLHPFTSAGLFFNRCLLIECEQTLYSDATCMDCTIVLASPTS